MATQKVLAGFSALRMQELSQRHLGEENIVVYGGFANRLIKLQIELLQAFDRHRRGNTQTINVHHVDIHPGGRGVSRAPREHTRDEARLTSLVSD